MLKRICSVEGGELFDRVVSLGQFEEPTAKVLFYQMVVAIQVSKFCTYATYGQVFFFTKAEVAV